MKHRATCLAGLTLAGLAGPSRLPAGPGCEAFLEGLRITASIRDSEPAVLEALIPGTGTFAVSVDWGDGSPREALTQGAGPLRLTHDYDLISTFSVRAEIKPEGGEQPVPCSPLLVSVSDDDDNLPLLTWDLPGSVVRAGEPAVVGWRLSDASGLDFVSVVIQGPSGRIASFDAPEGEFDLSGHGLGLFRIEVQALDGDDDRPGDGLGYTTNESVVIVEETGFRRGDSNGDSTVDVSDGIHTLLWLFRGSLVLRCADAADANDDGKIEISDAVMTFRWLFGGAAAPPPPGPLIPGPDPTADSLDCNGLE